MSLDTGKANVNSPSTDTSRAQRLRTFIGNNQITSLLLTALIGTSIGASIGGAISFKIISDSVTPDSKCKAMAQDVRRIAREIIDLNLQVTRD